ncbi:MAG: hypothetical protein HC863_00805 [Myxococcales bacterium]|nr:hypothetical protein [Myxococcales bacterium]
MVGRFHCSDQTRLPPIAVDKLSRGPNLRALPSDGAIQHVADTEILGDLPHIDSLAPVDFGRVAGDDIELVGISDLWGERQKRALLNEPAEKPRLVLTHNPSTILRLKPTAQLDLMIASHTHGGQIYAPFLTCALMRENLRSGALRPRRAGQTRQAGTDAWDRT